MFELAKKDHIYTHEPAIHVFIYLTKETISWRGESYRAERNAARVCVAFPMHQWGITLLPEAQALQLGKRHTEDTGWKEETWYYM